MELDDAVYRLKPMNCPVHILIYKNSPKSYRDLPARYAELGNVYRYERSGTMHGLLRVRGFTQDDAHIFCMPSQIESEVAACIDFAQAVLTHLWIFRVQGGVIHVGSERPRSLCRLRRELGSRQPFARQRAQGERHPVQNHPRRSRILRPQNRYQTR